MKVMDDASILSAPLQVAIRHYGESPTTLEQLTHVFHRLLAEISVPMSEALSRGEESTGLYLETDEALGAELLAQLFRPSVVDDVQYNMPSGTCHPAAQRRLGELFDLAQTRLHEAEFVSRQVLKLYMPVMVFGACGGSLRGGTSSGVPGLVWANVDSGWDLDTATEFLVHEFTHSVHFLQERLFGFYANAELLASPATWETSAIRRHRRPIDKVHHSVLVAAEIVYLRERLATTSLPDLHPDTHTLTASAVSSGLALLKNQHGVLSSHGIKLTEVALAALQQRL